MGVFINPGTEAREATEQNAVAVAERIVHLLNAPVVFVREQKDDWRGWYGFSFRLGHKRTEVLIPGDDPDEVCIGKPWVSRRLYVEGSSWLFGYAMQFIKENLGLEEDS